MRKFIFLISLILITSCNSQYIGQNKHNTTKYEVYKIDSINSYYLVYAKKGDSLYKIVSKKEHSINHKKISVNKSYNFILRSMASKAPTINGIKIKPINYMDVNCFRFDKETNICKEERIYDLYFVENLQGLYLKK